MPELPQVVVLTPTLGESPWLEQAVSSVASVGGGTHRLRHLLVAPADKVVPLASTFPDLEVVAEENAGGGLYAAINHAVRAVADWDWMTYLNDDDVLGSGFGRVLESAAIDSGDVLYGRVSYIDAEGRNLGAFPVEQCPHRFASLMAASIPPFTQQGTLVRRACFDRLGGFDRRYPLAADFDFWVRAVRAGLSFRYLPVEVGSFRLREGQLSADQERVQSEMKRIIEAHLGSPGRLVQTAVRTGFRLRHLPQILSRRWRTGRWRTDGSVGGGSS